MHETSLGLASTRDLVVLAPWRQEIIGADEAILPATRWARTFQALFALRRQAREATERPAFPDPVERLEQVHSFRIRATPQGLLLAVTYDFGWEPYMRALWRDGGPFLDLLLCNCADYRPARDIGVADWSAWIRARLWVSDYFYSATALTVGDLAALAQMEQASRAAADATDADRLLAGFARRTPDAVAAASGAADPAAAMRQALSVIAGMYRLTRFYGPRIAPGEPLAEDALTLLLAARALLPGFDSTRLPAPARAQFTTELAWFEQPLARPPAPVAAAQCIDRTNVQRGILTGFDSDGPITHGAVLVLMVTDGLKARAGLADLADAIANETGEPPEDGIFRNVALSHAGMERLGLSADLLAALPEALRQGAAERAGSVGDVRAFHPGQWQGLALNWPAPTGRHADAAIADVVIQLRVRAPSAAACDLTSPAHPLHAEVERIAALPGLRLLSATGTGPAPGQAPDHDAFGLRDGISQPSPDGKPGKAWSDRVAPGDLLLGYRNSAGETACSHLALRGGSLLAVRAMAQWPDRFEAMLAAAIQQTGLDRATLVGKLLGRTPDGTPLVAHHDANDFDYAGDPDGTQAPRQSHVRRSNPRDGSAVPRIVRRGMSWAGADGSHGLFFMAYCADLAEQYETLLRWVNGGNSSGLPSAMGDPLCGVPDAHGPRRFRFLHAGTVHRIDLPPRAAAPVDLLWSAYMFAPPISLLRSLADPPAAGAPAELPLAEARARIAALIAEDAGEAQWRELLDEPEAFARDLQAAAWAVIRQDHGGLLATRELVLAGSHAHVIEALRDDGRRFSVAGAGARIARSVERFHLGLDVLTDDYRREGPPCNAAIAAIDEATAFSATHAACRRMLAGLLQAAAGMQALPLRLDLMRGLFEPVVAAIAPAWFDFPDGRHVQPGAADWRPVASRTPVFPGDFWNPSRFAFNPFVSARTEQLAAEHGQALLNAITAFLAENGRDALRGAVSAALAEAMHQGKPAFPTNRDLARSIAGAMLGWIATTLGNAARIFDRLIRHGDIQRLQILWDDVPARGATAARQLLGPLVEALLCDRPVPENKWRLVVDPQATLGGTRVGRDDGPVKLVLGLQSAAADQAARGIADSHIPFGQAHAGAPTPHGCPGRSLALGVLLGLVAGVIETVRLQESGARLVVEISPRQP